MTAGQFSSVVASRAQDCWETPQCLFDQLNEEFGFTLDACASASNTKCERFFSIDSDGLLQHWGRHVVFMNPPYGRVIKQWMKKAYSAASEGAIVVCLIPARTDASWWHDYAMKGEVRLIRGRIQFGSSNNGAPFPNAIVIFRGQRRRSVKSFVMKREGGR